jgi:glycosyltransferase involved in cell wall biosynthesis
MKTIMASCGFEAIGSRRSFARARFDVRMAPLLSSLGGVTGYLDEAKHHSFAIYRPIPQANRGRDDSLTICLTCRNEKGNIEPIVRAIPVVSERQEILFVEGHSDDGTRAEIERVIGAYAEKNIRLISQPGIGQGDAIREGFSRATGAFIILLEADMTSPPEDILPVYESLRAGFGEFIGGTRFFYAMTRGSMPLTNRLANWIFARYFSWLFNQHVSDVLCGIKGISKVDFDKIAARWGQWGVEDPFGDFELLFGAVQIGLKVGEIPVHYRPRPYGRTKTRAFQHGGILFRLAARAFLAFRR